MSRYGHLRASDADRDQVVERLRNAAREGRIATDELDERLGSAFSARTYADLEALTQDLPGARVARQRSSTPTRTVAKLAVAVAILVPMLMAAIFVLTSVVAVWMLWAVVGWWFFGHRYHHGRRRPYGGSRHPGVGTGRGFRI